MKSYVELIQKHRKPLLIILVLINLCALAGIFRLNINPSFDIFMPRESRYKEILSEMNRNFGSSEQIIYLIEIDQPELSPSVMKKFRDFQGYLEEMNNIAHVKGPAPEKIPSGPTGYIYPGRAAAAELTGIKEYYQMLGSLSPLREMDRKIYGSFTLFADAGFGSSDINLIEDYLQENELTYYASGDLYLQEKVIDYILLILLFLPPLAFLLILSVFKTRMGSFKATFLSVAPAGLGALWTVGLIGWIGREVSIITVLAPIFTIVIGSADGLHFVSHVQEERDEGKGVVESIVETLKMVGMPMVITTVTSMAGFLALLVMNTDAVRDLAVFASIGIFLAGLATWYVLPLILSGGTALHKPGRNRGLFVNGIKKLWGLPSLIILVMLLLTAFYGTQSIKTEFNQLMVYKDYTAVHRGFEKIMEVNGGSVPVFLNIETREDPLAPHPAEEVIALENELKNSPYVSRAVSPYDFYAAVFAGFAGQKEPVYPANLLQVNMINTRLSREGVDPADYLINRENKAVRVMVFPADLQNETLDGISRLIEQYTKEQGPDEIKIELTGVQYLMRDLNRNMIANQTNTLLLAFILIFILLFVSLRKFLPSLVSLLPIAFTVYLLYGFLGLTGISLNLITATIFSITIGVGIDYAIHFTSVWMSFRKRGLNPDQAVEKAYIYTSRPVLANALGLAVGLSALLLSPLRIHFYVSLLMWVSMVSSVFFSLSLLPTILRRVK